MPNNQQVAAVARNLKSRLLETISYPGSAVPTRTRLPRDYVFSALNLRFSGTVTIAGGAASGTVAPESPMSILRDIKIEGSSPMRPAIGLIKQFEAAVQYRLNEILYGAPGERVNLTSGDIQAATPVSFSIRIPFEMPYCENPRITWLNTRELAALDLVIQWGDATDLIVGGDRTITLNTFQVEVSGIEYLDGAALTGRYGIHRVSFIEQAVAASNSRLVVDIKRGYVLRGVLLKQFTQVGTVMTPVNTIITQASIELNREVKLQHNTWAGLQADNKTRYAIQTTPVGYAFLDVMPEKLLDSLIDTRDYETVSAVLNVTTAANARFRVFPVEILPAY